MIPWLRRLQTPVLTGVFVWVCAFLVGCATPQVSTLESHWPADLPVIADIKGVPFFPQEDYECGPASLAMVATAAGVKVKPEDLVEQVYLPGRKGALQQEMMAATRRQGLLAYPLNTSLETLMHEVAAGNPVLVFQNLSFSFYPVWHYAVVIGYDRDRRVFTLHSGRTERMEISLFTFERTWARAQYWSMLALKPGQLPATAEVEVFTAAAAALERINPQAAQTAYSAALKRWPDDKAALFGAGNTAYALGQRQTAASAYRVAVTRHADFADAWNNLAQVLLDLGQRPAAAKAIAKAIALGGPRLTRYQELAAKINQK
jgi:tetratricopeptide (TPR) repeat protein